MKTIATVLSLLVLAFHGSFAGSVLISWDIPTSSNATSAGTVTANTGLSGSAITLGSGLTATANTSASGWGGENFSGWTAVTTLGGALAAGDFFQWSVSVATGYSLSLDGIGALSMFRSGSGAGNTNNSIGLYYSIAGGAYTLAGQGPSGSTGVSTSGSSSTSLTSLGGSWATTPLSVAEGQTIIFRLAAFQANTNALGGTLRFSGTATQDLSLTGFLTSLNVPYSWTGTAGSWATGTGGWDSGSWVNGKDANLSGGTLTVAAGGITAGAISVSGTTNTLINGAGFNSAGISKSGSSVLELATSSANVVSNGISVTAGTLKAGASDVLNGALTMSAGTTLDLGSTTNTSATVSLTDTTVSGTGTLNGSSFAVSVSSGTNTISAALGGSGASLSKTGAGELVLAGDNQFNGTLTVSGGVVRTSGNERIHNSAVLAPGTGSTIRLGGNESVGALSSSATSSSIDIGANNLTIGFNTSSNSFSGNLTGSGSVTKLGAGTQSFGTNNSWTGGFVLKEGNVRIIGNGALDTNYQMQTHALGKGTLTLEGGTIQSSTAGTDLSTTTGRTLYNNVNLNGGFTSGATGEVGRIAISTNAGGSTVLSKDSTINTVGNAQWYQAIDGSSFRITKTGTATLELLNSNNIGGVTVQQGILGYGNKNALGLGTVNLADGTTFGQSATIAGTDADRTLANNLSVQGNATLGVGSHANFLSGNVDLNGATRTLTMGNTTTFSGDIQNGGLSVVASNKTVTFNGASTYSGGTTFAASVGGSTNNIIVNNTTGSAFGSGAVTVRTGNNLGGSGIISGATTMETGSLLRPGNSPGVLTFGSDLTLNTGANLVWELWANTELNSPNIAFDQIVVGGNLLFGGANGVTLDFGTTLGGSLVNWTDTFWDSQRSWILYDVTGTTTGASNLSLLNTVYNDATGASLATARSGASFSIAQVGSDVVVNYIPEPSSSSLMLLGLSGLIGMRAFRRKV
jgi:autotransporter-associated beta strand protein